MFADPREAVLAAALFAINPAFLMVGAWAMIGSIAYAVLMGLGSIALLLGRGSHLRITSESNHRRTWSAGAIFNTIGAAGLLFAAMCLYQPGAMAFWTGLAVWILGKFAATREDWRKLAGIAVLFFAVSFLYFLIVSWQADATSRVHVLIHPLRRTVWFVVFPLKTTLYFPFFKTSFLWSIAAFGVLSCGLVLYGRQTSRNFWMPILIALVLPLTLLPMLIASAHYDALRIRASLYGVIILLWCVTLKALTTRYAGAIKPWHLMAVVLVISAATGPFFLLRYLIIPQVREESAVQMELLQYVRENPLLDRQIVLLPAQRNFRFAQIDPTDELGIPSTAQFWSADNLVHQVLAGITHRGFEDVKNVKVLTLYQNETPPPGSFVIDLREFRVPR